MRQLNDHKDIINPSYEFCIKLKQIPGIAKKADEMIDMLDRHKIDKNNQITAGLPGLSMHAIKLTPEKHYDWHFDNCDWDFGKKIIKFTNHNRYWTHLIYLTDGAHLELGALNFDEKVAVETQWSAPPTNKIIAKIYPQPGKSIIFPSFIAHRVHPNITKERWSLTEFVTRVDYEGFTQETYNKAKELYFNEYTRRFGISP